MRIRIELHIKGWQVHQECQDIADIDERQDFRMNVTIREYQVSLWSRKIRTEFNNKIEKSEGRWQIFVFIESAGNNMEILDTEMQELDAILINLKKRYNETRL